MTEHPQELEQRDHQGRLMLRLSPSSDRFLLPRVGEVLEREFAAATKDRFSSPSDVFWDYELRGRGLSLYWQREGGLWLLAGSTDDDAEVQLRQLASALRRSVPFEAISDPGQ